MSKDSWTVWMRPGPPLKAHVWVWSVFCSCGCTNGFYDGFLSVWLLNISAKWHLTLTLRVRCGLNRWNLFYFTEQTAFWLEKWGFLFSVNSVLVNISKTWPVRYSQIFWGGFFINNKWIYLSMSIKEQIHSRIISPKGQTSLPLRHSAPTLSYSLGQTNTVHGN